MASPRIRLRDDWVLCRCEPFEEKVGSLIVLAQHQRVRHGEVLSVGPKAKVKVGVRVAFFREHMEHLQGKQIKRILMELEDNLSLMHEYDILLEVEKGVVVSV